MSSISVPHWCAQAHPCSLCKLNLHSQLWPKVQTKPTSNDDANLLKHRETRPEKHRRVTRVIKWTLWGQCHMSCCLPMQAQSFFAKVAKVALLNKCSRWAESKQKDFPLSFSFLAQCKAEDTYAKPFHFFQLYCQPSGCLILDLLQSNLLLLILLI